MGKKLFYVLSVFVICFSITASSGFADVIHLKNGNSFEGVIESQSDGEIVIGLEGGTISLDMVSVDKIEKKKFKLPSKKKKSDGFFKKIKDKYFSSDDESKSAYAHKQPTVSTPANKESSAYRAQKMLQQVQSRQSSVQSEESRIKGLMYEADNSVSQSSSKLMSKLDTKKSIYKGSRSN